MLIHTVTQNESIESIAARYHISVAKLIEDNGLSAPYSLIEGQTLCIPIPALFHTVFGGEREQEIASEHQTNVDSLLQLNPAFCQAGALYPGQILRVSSETRMPATVFGFIKRPLPMPELSALLPYLTFLVISPAIRSEAIARYVKEAKRRGVSTLYEGKSYGALSTLFDGLFFSEEEGYHLTLKGGREDTHLFLGERKEAKDGCLLSLSRPLLLNGEEVSPSLLPRLLSLLKREGGKIERDENGNAVFSHVERRHGKAETIRVAFCDAKKEKALLEKNSREGFHSFIIGDTAEWNTQSRLVFASLFSPVKLKKSE